MKTEQIASTLRALPSLAADRLSEADRRTIGEVASALDQASKQTLSAITKAVVKATKSEPCDTAVTSTLEALAKVFSAAGVATAAKDLAALAGLFKALAGVPTESLRQHFETALTKPAKPSAKMPTGKAAVNVREVADQLTAVLSDNEAFDQQMIAVQKLSKDELSAVAARFLGYDRSYKTKTEIIKAIVLRQRQDALQSSRDRGLSKLGV